MPICKRINGDYHVDGDLPFAPKELQFTIFGDAKPLLEAASGRRAVLISPIPRYLLKSCCLDTNHAGTSGTLTTVLGWNLLSLRAGSS